MADPNRPGLPVPGRGRESQPGGATSSPPGSNFNGLNAGAMPYVPPPSSIPGTFGSGAAAGTGATRRLATTFPGGATSVLAGPTAPASSVFAATSAPASIYALATTGASLGGDTSGITGHLGHQEEDSGSTVFVPSSRDPVHVPSSRYIALRPIGQIPQDRVKLGSASAGDDMINSSAVSQYTGAFSSRHPPASDEWNLAGRKKQEQQHAMAICQQQEEQQQRAMAICQQQEEEQQRAMAIWRQQQEQQLAMEIWRRQHQQQQLAVAIWQQQQQQRALAIRQQQQQQRSMVFWQQIQQQHRAMTPSASSRAATGTSSSSSAAVADMGLVGTTPPPPPPHPPPPSAGAAEGSPSPTAPGPGNGGAIPTTGADQKNVGEVNDVDYPRLPGRPYGPM